MCPSLEAVAIVSVKPNRQCLRCGRVESVDRWPLSICQQLAREGLVFGAMSPGIMRQARDVVQLGHQQLNNLPLYHLNFVLYILVTLIVQRQLSVHALLNYQSKALVAKRPNTTNLQSIQMILRKKKI